MLTDQQVEEFNRDGFLNGGRVLGNGEVEELAAELDRVLRKGEDGFAEDEPRPVLLRDLNEGLRESGSGRSGRWSTSGRPRRPSSASSIIRPSSRR